VEPFTNEFLLEIEKEVITLAEKLRTDVNYMIVEDYDDKEKVGETCTKSVNSLLNVGKAKRNEELN